MNNSIATQPQRPKFSVMISTPVYQRMINNTLQDPKKAQRFIAAITSAVAITPALQECDPSTVIAGALVGESLNLSPSPQLGQYYLVPFNNTKKGCKDAQFVIGYKGYIQLALRSGYYKRLNVLAVKAGELVRFDPLTEDVELNLNPNELAREDSATVGYLAMFEYLNGFRKTLYWSREKMEAHALAYSKGYSAKKGYTFWEKDFDAMAFKTLLRQLISKWGVMSIDLQTAFEKDDTIHTDEEYFEAHDAPPSTVERDLLTGPEESAGGEQVNLDDL